MVQDVWCHGFALAETSVEHFEADECAVLQEDCAAPQEEFASLQEELAAPKEECSTSQEEAQQQSLPVVLSNALPAVASVGLCFALVTGAGLDLKA